MKTEYQYPWAKEPSKASAALRDTAIYTFPKVLGLTYLLVMGTMLVAFWPIGLMIGAVLLAVQLFK